MKHICSYLFLIIFTILCLNLPVFSYDLLQELNGNTTVKPKYLPVEEAFIATITSAENQTTVSISIAPEYYLYRHLVKVSLNEGNFEIKDLPEGIFHHDDFMGDSYVFFDQLDFKISYSNLKPDSELSISYQGCTQGMCYPPVKSNIKLGEYAKQSEKNSDSTARIKGFDIRPYCRTAELFHRFIFGFINCFFLRRSFSGIHSLRFPYVSDFKSDIIRQQ